ncbi:MULTISPECIES: hypothetical protein [Bacillaceae]|uniref:Uncharacterized protein n=1 Tax=Evansella alkalicola TaxID=745819 RepID=A0ABS6JX93_9BACI|nr:MULTISPECIES: hypothetical protein [Bacillaceae]MBU9723208.1 hypothetical protein [Bacillus alkalicola]
MKKIKERLGEKDIRVLKGIIGLELHGVLSPTLSTKMGSHTYTLYWSISFSFNRLLKKSFVNITNDYRESDADEDYWRLDVKEAAEPENISYHYDEELSDKALAGPFSTINIWSVIKKISVYSKKMVNDEEHLEYDAVLVFHLENGQQLGLTHDLMFIKLTYDSERIKEMTKHCYERLCLE